MDKLKIKRLQQETNNIRREIRKMLTEYMMSDEAEDTDYLITQLVANEVILNKWRTK